MKIQLVGKEKLDFKTDDGTQMKGYKISCIDFDTRRTGLEGYNTFTSFLADGTAGANAVAKASVGQKYEAYFNNKGKLEVLLDAKV